MIYFYIKNGDLYSTDTPILNDDFIEITENEYNRKLTELEATREQGIPVLANRWNETTLIEQEV